MKLKKFIVDSYNELTKRVVWPKIKALQSSSKLVLIASLVFAIVIYVMDMGFDTIMSWFYNELFMD